MTFTQQPDTTAYETEAEREEREAAQALYDANPDLEDDPYLPYPAYLDEGSEGYVYNGPTQAEWDWYLSISWVDPTEL